MPAIFVSASNAISFSDSQEPDPVLHKNTSDFLALSDWPASNFFIEEISQTFTVSDSASQTFKFVSEISTLSLSQTVSRTGTQNVSATSALSLSSAAISTVKEQSVTSTLSFTDSATGTAPILRDVGHNMSIGDIENIDPADIPAVNDPLFAEKMAALLEATTLRDEATVRYAVKIAAVTQFLSLAEGSVPNTWENIVSSHIHFLDVAYSVEYEPVTDVLSFQQNVSVTNVHSGTSSLDISQTLSFNLVWSRTTTSTLNLTQAVLFQGESSSPLGAWGPNAVIDPRQQYDADGSIPEVCPLPVTIASSVTWTYPPPPSPAATTLIIRPPELRNQETFNYRRINRRTRGGQLEIFRRDIWPKWVRLQMTYAALTAGERQAIFQFFKLTLGIDVGFLDWEGRQWVGIITTPQAAFEQLGKGCRHEITFEFQGVCQ